MFIFLQDVFSCIVKILYIDNVASLINGKVDWLGEALPLMKIDGNQLDHSDSEGEAVEINNEPEIDEGSIIPRNNSIATGLIKIFSSFIEFTQSSLYTSRIERFNILKI